MSNDTARLRRWAESVLAMPAGHHDEDVLAAADHIMATTDPPTMADVEWNDDKHYLGGATDGDGDAVVMCGENADGEINVIVLWDHHTYSTPKGQLTPSGKRYELCEVGAPEEPEYPETLTTLEDYEGAPEGTIVARKDYSPYAKLRRGYWEHPRYIPRTDASMADTPRKVIRWGDGK